MWKYNSEEERKEARRESSRKWAAKNRERVNETSTKWQNDNREKVREYKRDWYNANKDKARIHHARFAESQNGRACILVGEYNKTDKDTGRGECSITKEWIVEHIFTSKCVYCGDNDWRHLGCDRIDNGKAHTEDNVVCSCGICNVERFYKRMSVEEFIDYRKTHPRDEEPKKLEKVVEINGKKVIRKVL